MDWEGRQATFGEVIRGCKEQEELREFFNRVLADVEYKGFRWETPGVTEETVSQAFEFVLLDSPGLGHRPDPTAFAEHFAATDELVAVFPNLGGHAMMIAPCPISYFHNYGHLAAFVRLAPTQQQHALWQAVGTAMEQRLNTQPVWLSTAGAGVSWLHVRLDDQPKYYGFEPYRVARQTP